MNSSRVALMVCGFVALGAQGAATQSTPAPCSLLTQAQVSGSLGVSTDAGQPIGTTGCTWSSPHIKATVSFWDASKWVRMKTPLAGMTKTPIGGFGDDAFVATVGTTQQFVSLTVKKGVIAVTFKVYGVESPPISCLWRRPSPQTLLRKCETGPT
jgi:hypothetical protein